jgi:hypothetical protein
MFSGRRHEVSRKNRPMSWLEIMTLILFITVPIIVYLLG